MAAYSMTNMLIWLNYELVGKFEENGLSDNFYKTF